MFSFTFAEQRVGDNCYINQDCADGMYCNNGICACFLNYIEVNMKCIRGKIWIRIVDVYVLFEWIQFQCPPFVLPVTSMLNWILANPEPVRQMFTARWTSLANRILDRRISVSAVTSLQMLQVQQTTIIIAFVNVNFVVLLQTCAAQLKSSWRTIKKWHAPQIFHNCNVQLIIGVATIRNCGAISVAVLLVLKFQPHQRPRFPPLPRPLPVVNHHRPSPPP